MEDKILLALGYPIGTINKDAADIYYVDTKDGLYPMSNTPQILLWQLCLYGNDYQTIKSKFLETNNSEQYFNLYLEKLISKDLILETSLDTLDIYNKIKSRKLFRQGIGLGVDKKNNSYHISTSKKIELSCLEYHIWSLANNTQTIEELLLSIFETDSIDEKHIAKFTTIIMNLYVKGAAYIC